MVPEVMVQLTIFSLYNGAMIHIINYEIFNTLL